MEAEGIDYHAWYHKIQHDIASLPAEAVHSRAQRFIQQFPDALLRFDEQLSNTSLARSLAAYQRHPNFLLRFLLAEWRDEARKELRTSLDDVMTHSVRRVQQSQAWRAGQGEFWTRWGFKDIDDLYTNYTNTPQVDAKMQAWFPQRFYGHDRDGYPVHYELLPNTFEPQLLRDMTLRRVVNNEHTVRFRELAINPPPQLARQPMYTPLPGTSPQAETEADERCQNPRIGVTWVIDCRRLSIWQSASIYKTAQAMIEASQQVTSQNYPEQGHQALVINLGTFWGSMYNLAMAVMPAQTQRSTSCFIGNDVLGERIGWENVPSCFQNGSKKIGFTKEEEERAQADAVPSVRATS